jgi:hypothetical protein
MPRKTSIVEAVATIGIDIGKNTFHLIGLDKKGAIVLRQKLSRCQVEARLANPLRSTPRSRSATSPPRSSCHAVGRPRGRWAL